MMFATDVDVGHWVRYPEFFMMANGRRSDREEAGEGEEQYWGQQQIRQDREDDCERNAKTSYCRIAFTKKETSCNHIYIHMWYCYRW